MTLTDQVDHYQRWCETCQAEVKSFQRDETSLITFLKRYNEYVLLFIGSCNEQEHPYLTHYDEPPYFLKLTFDIIQNIILFFESENTLEKFENVMDRITIHCLIDKRLLFLSETDENYKTEYDAALTAALTKYHRIISSKDEMTEQGKLKFRISMLNACLFELLYRTNNCKFILDQLPACFVSPDTCVVFFPDGNFKMGRLHAEDNEITLSDFEEPYSLFYSLLKPCSENAGRAAVLLQMFFKYILPKLIENKNK